MARPILLSALKVPETGLRAYRCELILVKMDFFALGMKLGERGDSARVGQRWFTEATGLSRKSRDVANLKKEENFGTLHM